MGIVRVSPDGPMRIPSRRMPKAVERKVGPLGWSVLGVLLGGLVYLVLVHPILTGAVCVFIAIADKVAAANMRVVSAKLDCLATERAGEGICEFARMFNYRATDTWVIRAVYEEVQGCMGSEFPLRATDRLTEDLYVEPDDFEIDIVMRVAERTGRTLEDFKRNPYYGKVSTVGHLVNFFNNQPYGRKGVRPRFDFGDRLSLP